MKTKPPKSPKAPKPAPKEADVVRQLGKLRAEIDRADRLLLSALGARARTVGKIGELKVRHGLPLLQKARWASMLEERVSAGRRAGLGEKFTAALYKLIHKEALRIQRELRDRKAAKRRMEG